MNKIIEINKLTYRYSDEFVLYNLSLDIEKDEWVTVVGSNGSGKSTLVKILSGIIITDNDIVINGYTLSKNNLKKIRKSIGVVFENPENSFICETVKEDISLILKNLNYEENKIEQRIKEISKLLNIEELLNKDSNNLSGGESQKVAIACALIHNPKILILDEGFSMMDEKTKKEVLKVINNIRDKEHMTIINITHNLDEVFYSNRLIVLNKGELILDGPPQKVVLYDKLLNKMGIELPFIVDLSLKLKLYGLIDKIFFDASEMIDTIWK